MATMAADSTALMPFSRPDSASAPLSDADAWDAVERRDARFDGQFVYAVRSTRVYCRPSCPSRRPSRHNVSFFVAADDAERAGFRPCRRCDPRDAGPTGETSREAERAVARARAFLDANTDRTVSLDELAGHAGLSASHLRRVFARVVGVSPKQYQHAHRVDRFKARLRAGETVSRATYEAGFGSSSRVYERSDELLGMTPASYRRGGAGVSIRYTIASAPVGRVLVALTDRGVCAVMLGATDAEVERGLRADFPSATIERSEDERHEWVHAVLARVRGARAGDGAENEPIRLDVHGTAFQQQVWAALQEIPLGERRSYTQVAAAIGRPRATRAVARACGANHIAVVVPCHRVVREDGGLAGYRWGVERKRTLLDAEAE